MSAREKNREQARSTRGGGGVCAREKNREQARSTRGGGWGLRAKRARRNREAVDIFGKKSAY